MTVLHMTDIDLQGKRVLIREDLNVPLKEGRVASDARILAALPTIQLALEKGAQVMVMSHLGRPSEGMVDDQYSLQPVVNYLQDTLDVPVRLEKDYLNGVSHQDNEIIIFENVRFNQGEKANDDTLAQQLASLCDVFVMDAFGTAHRAQASTHGIAKYAKTACAGPLLVAELEALSKALEKPARPMVAIVGGSKVSTKLQVLETLSSKVDQLVVGGGIANTFIAAQGHNVGQSLFEDSLIPDAKRLMENAQDIGGDIPVPSDVIVGQAFSAEAEAILRPVSDIQQDDMVFDIGPDSAEVLAQIIAKAGTIVWNGPVGVFEFEQFSQGTERVAQAIAESRAFSIAGGGDTLAAIDKYQIADKVSYISTGGGAFLEFLEGKKLPAVEVLEQRARGSFASQH
ncbi:phosphoglycerate kinase [Algicola sagamiensis]|uniref:phosphoglycerate kinase n=1 Tax=Algicola sagamiensis TaxID=163869 RepID=UPI000372FF58|nr:phosphoglycerate kinase [Algicola sagamiensis]